LAEISTLIAAGAIALTPGASGAQTTQAAFGPFEPVLRAQHAAFHAPPFDKIKDSDYQPAIDAGMARSILRRSAPSPTIRRSRRLTTRIVAMEKSGNWLIDRVMEVFNGVTGANMNPVLQKVQDVRGAKAGRAAGCEFT
jgi:peptidyl-dipeptidase Dcp